MVRIFSTNESMEELVKWCQKNMCMGIVEDTNLTTDAKDQILNYFYGKRKFLDFPIVHLNTPFRTRILDAERNIPYGQTCS